MKIKSLLFLLPLLALIGIFAEDDVDQYDRVAIATTMWAEGPVTLTMATETEDFTYELPQHLESWSGFGNDGLTFDDAEVNSEKATLGKVLFYDKNLSKNKTLSCGSCHHQELGFAEDKKTSSGFNGNLGLRNAVSLSELDFTPYTDLFWDDRMSDLEEMAMAPFTNEHELGMDSQTDVVEEIENLDYYTEYFESAYGSSEVTPLKIGNALGHFVRSIAAVDTKLDNSLVALAAGASEEVAWADWTESELLGKQIFQQDCETCHVAVKTAINQVPQIFNLPHNTGLDAESIIDLGVGGVTGSASTIGAFKTPSLRNVTKTGPYMHDGRFETLEEVVEFYSEGLELHPNSAFNPNSPTNQQYYGSSAPIPEGILDQNGDVILNENGTFGHQYTAQEQLALIDFMGTLDDVNTTSNPIWSDPFITEGTLSGIDSEDIILSAYPNPTTDIINIGSYSLFEGDVTVSIYNTAGQMVRNEITSGDVIQVAKDDLIPGNYIINLTDGKSRNSVKVQFQ